MDDGRRVRRADDVLCGIGKSVGNLLPSYSPRIWRYCYMLRGNMHQILLCHCL